MSIHAVLLAVSGCALFSALAGGPLAARTPQLRQMRRMALLISSALTVGNAACLLPDVPTWYSATLVTLTTVGLFWVVAATFKAQRDAAVQARQERVAQQLRGGSGATRAAQPSASPGAARRTACGQPRRETPRGELHALPTPTNPDGPARPALGRNRPGRPHLSVVTATPVPESRATTSSLGTTRPTPSAAARALPRPSAAAVVTDLPTLPAAQRHQLTDVVPPMLRAAPTPPSRSGLAAVARSAEPSLVTRADLNATTPRGTHPQALYVARDITTYSEPARSRRDRFARVQARATLAAAWRARVADAYDDEPSPPTRLRDTRA